MKTIERQTTTESEGVQASAQMHIKNENLHHVFNVLRNSLYSNKPLAILREYACNAWDSHVEAGNPDPIQITLPNALDCNLRIRDFGTGLSHEDMFEVYSSYGESTKRNTNKQIGQLGLGSKSAFAYANSFSITSYFNGEKTVYEAYIDKTGLGRIDKLFSEKTNEHNGIEITVKVKPEDINLFYTEAKRLFIWWENKPVIIGNEEVRRYLETYTREPLIEKDNWSVYKNKDYSNAVITLVMGNIAYAVDIKNFDEYDPNIVWLKKLQYTSLVIRANIGAVEFSANREGLEYGDKTKNYLYSTFAKIKKTMVLEAQSKIDTAKNLFEARTFAKEICNTLGAFIHIKDLTFNGEALVDFCINQKTLQNLDIYVRQEVHNWRATRWEQCCKEHLRIYPYDNPLFVLDTFDFPRYQVASKLRKVTELYPSRTKYYIRMQPDVLQGFHDTGEFIGAELVNLITIEGDVKIRTFNKKAYSKVFKFNGNTNPIRPSEAWDIVEANEAKSHVYVKIDRYLPIAYHKLENLAQRLSLYEQVFGKKLTIYGVKSSAKVPEKWVELTDFLRKQINSLSKSPKVRQEIDLMRFLPGKITAPYYSALFQNRLQIKGKILQDAFKKTELALHLVPKYDYEHLKKLASLSNIDIENWFNQEENAMDMIEKQYQLLPLVTQRWDWHDKLSAIIDYINMMDDRNEV